MFDGSSDYPQNIIEKTKKDEIKIKNKIKFNCIMFGEDKDGIKCQKKISKNLKGKFTNAISKDELQISFREVINEGFK